jgi:hypothetical protein
MARIRTVKPEYWTDEKVGECSVSARLLFIASLNFADDYGGLERTSKQLKAQVFPYDGIDCEPLVLELIRVGLFIEYQVADRKYLHIKGFRKHQKVEKPAKPRIPVYEESPNCHRLLPEDSPTPPRGVAVSSLEGNGMEWNGSKNPSAHAKLAPRVSIDIDELKAVYPNRSGDQGWSKAARAAQARIAEGHSWPEMIAGVTRYAAFVHASGKEGSEFVKQAATFLGPDKPFLLPWDLPRNKAENQREANIDASRAWLSASH